MTVIHQINAGFIPIVQSTDVPTPFGNLAPAITKPLVEDIWTMQIYNVLVFNEDDFHFSCRYIDELSYEIQNCI